MSINEISDFDQLLDAHIRMKRYETRDSTDAIQSESQVISHHSGYSPGVDPNNLKGILNEEDIERYRRVSAQ